MPRAIVMLGIGFWIAMAVGCGSMNHYRAERLPVKYMAPPVENVQEIDLSRLSNFSANNELIDRGDVIEVTILTDYARLPAITAPVRVGEDGNAEIPQVGTLMLAGIELEEAEETIAAAGVQRNVFRHPRVTVTMRRQRYNRVTVIGAVEKTGVVKLPRGSSTLLAALVEAGGLSKDAGPNVEIRRAMAAPSAPCPMPGDAPRVAQGKASLTSFESSASEPADVICVNLTEAAQAGDGGHFLQDGDVVMVGKRLLEPIHVIGLVRKPDKYDLPPNREVRVLDALAMAGDRTMQAADKVLIIRRVEGREEPIRIDVSVREAKDNGAANIRLAPGDIVSVEDTPTTVVLATLQRVVRIAVGGSVGFF